MSVIVNHDSVSQVFDKWGVAGAIIVGLAGYIMYLHKMYGKRLKEMDEKHQADREDFKKIAKEGFDNVKESTNIISSLKTLFEIGIKNK